jgi:NhaC family Na+:H+ antiporter
MSATDKAPHSGRQPSLIEALILIAVSACLTGGTVVYCDTDAHIALVLSATITAAAALFILKCPWKVIEESMTASIMLGTQTIITLFAVGILIGTWIQSGVAPTMIYYGLYILNPSTFLIAALLVCSVVSITTGTSWGTTGTIGLALMGVAAGLGIPAPTAAGFIISGAYFGDRISPLSDATNLAPAISGTDIFQHIRAMTWTTAPTYIIVIVVAGVLGAGYSSSPFDAERVKAIQHIMSAEFHISPIALIPPILVIALAAAGKPPFPSVLCGALAGFILALIGGAPFKTALDVMQNGYTPTLTAEIIALAGDMPALTAFIADKGLSDLSTESILNGASTLNDLLARGGLQSMTRSISLILCALIFGGILDRCGFLDVILRAVLKHVKTVGGYILAVTISCILTNAFACDRYISIVIPGRMFRKVFDEKGLHPRMLSRALVDSGTITSALIPWNACGIYQTKTLGIAAADYLPYAVFNYLNPIIAVIMTYMGVGIAWKGKEGQPVIAREKPADQ